MRLLIFCLLGLFCTPLFAQLTFHVTSIPANTPVGADIYVAGTFNNWNPGDPAFILNPIGNGEYALTFNPAPGALKFKFTRGSWATVEGDANGQFLPDRTFAYNGQPTTVDLSILSWEDVGGTGGSTAAPNVSVLDDDFYMPQLNRTRRIWIYLPPDYDSTAKRYPVLYMHDAQNLFDNKTSFAGEWKVDESLNTLFTLGDYGCIVVGIDNGGTSRLDEYSPWVNPQYGGGEGDAYVQFITETLKPVVDSLYRTLPERKTTGIMGSSMGGLISMYAFSERQDVFSRAGVFSPAFWFAGNEPANHVANNPKEGEARVYFLAGGQEPASVAANMKTVAQAMLTAGFDTLEQFFLIEPDGQHSEWFWAREFPDAYVWLFANVVSHANEPLSSAVISVYPNPGNDWIRLAYTTDPAVVSYQIWDASGRLFRDTTAAANDPIFIGNLPSGYYVLRMRKGAEPGWKVARFFR